MFRFAPGIKRNENKARIRCKHKKQVPKWQDKFQVLMYYHLARRFSEALGIRLSVDHIVPLNHPKVCGLHCHLNLQLLTVQDNCDKSNKLDQQLAIKGVI